MDTTMEILHMGVAKPIAVKLDQDLRDRLQHLAKARERSTHWLMRKAIEEFVEVEEKREALRQEALNAWAEYQETGLHVTHDEADAWLARLEAGDAAKAPECHE